MSDKTNSNTNTNTNKSKPKNGTRFIGAHVDSELHKRIKIKCAERGLTIHEAIIKGLFLVLDMEEISEELIQAVR